MDRFLQNFPIQKITPSDSLFPETLKNIAEAPQELFFRGNFKPNEKFFAIVGTRLPSNYGKEIAFSIAKDLSQAGFCIVSGMALGIDTWSHKGALKNYSVQISGRRTSANFCSTMAVFGTGLSENVIYPQENLKLAKEILEKNGCLISEYSPETRGANFTFPKRNRIIAGLSAGVLVVEAKIKSGALITAKYAKKYKKPIFAIPGDIHNQNSKGPHLLIKQGAKLVESANDILKELGEEKTNQTQNLFLPPEELLVASALENGPLHIDKIIEITKLPSQAISGIICIMELEDKIKNLGGNIYSLN
ncbi:MAG: DNA-processing protein DprA [Candidatus Pacebacteria bacterium]|nr:DNA-processing protein DprA [Candidatus Paceibacterota bacterium]